MSNKQDGSVSVLWIEAILDQREFSESVVGVDDGCLSFQERHQIKGGRLNNITEDRCSGTQSRGSWSIGIVQHVVRPKR